MSKKVVFIALFLCLVGLAFIFNNQKTKTSDSTLDQPGEYYTSLISDFYSRPEEYKIINLDTDQDVTEQVYRDNLERFQKGDFAGIVQYLNEREREAAFTKIPADVPDPLAFENAEPSDFFICRVVQLYTRTDSKRIVRQDKGDGSGEKNILEQFLKDNQESYEKGDFEAIRDYCVEQDVVTIKIEGELKYYQQWKEDQQAESPPS
ncbi:MAG: hypothetical protein VB085_02850 [Peptococcaceae bacterium]|nr:hypothetical protein [Peptococcaceae bacterium]